MIKSFIFAIALISTMTSAFAQLDIGVRVGRAPTPDIRPAPAPRVINPDYSYGTRLDNAYVNVQGSNAILLRDAVTPNLVSLGIGGVPFISYEQYCVREAYRPERYPCGTDRLPGTRVCRVRESRTNRCVRWDVQQGRTVTRYCTRSVPAGCAQYESRQITSYTSTTVELQFNGFARGPVDAFDLFATATSANTVDVNLAARPGQTYTNYVIQKNYFNGRIVFTITARP